MIPVFIVALLMGLTGSLHCAGMCGPIMLFLPFYHFTGIRRVSAIALYHFSRISVYALMGLIIYSFKEAFNPHVQQYISIGLGSLLLAAGIISFLPAGGKMRVKLPWSAFVQRQLTRFLGSPGLVSIAVSGLLNGLLPCGLVYMALSATLSLHTAGEAVLFMYVFGAGTLPVLVSIILFRNRLKISGGNTFKKLTPVIVFSFGCLFLLRGLNLGIPYLSPKVEVAKGKIHSCCHRQ